MSFHVDQLMQVKCKFQLTSETDSSEIQLNSERVRLCTSVDVDKNSTLLVMICSNENGNNHIVVYYIERKTHDINFNAATKPRIIIKQIYYHSYNEDIVAISLSETGNKLALINASSTIYILPIKNILLNLHAKQLRSSQGKSMYFYDATIIDCCTLDNPTAIAYWESLETENKSTVIVASEKGELDFISVEDKKLVNETYINESIRYMNVVRDRFSYSLLITGDSFRQYRFALELVKQHQDFEHHQQLEYTPQDFNNDDYIYLEKDILLSTNRKPILIKLQSNSVIGSSKTAAAIQRVLVPSCRSSSQTSLFNSLHSRDRSIPLIFNQSPNMISVVDILGVSKSTTTSNNNRSQTSEPRLLRFFSNKQFYYRPQKPLLVCKLSILDPDEMITHTVLTDRFLAITTDRHRCLINSRNCCNLKYSNSAIDVDPLVKEITFNNEEKILLMLKSPISNDQDCIIDSFLLVTNRSIYSIEARQSCRDMFINLIDTHLGNKPLINTKKSNMENLVPNELNPNEYTFVDSCIIQRKISENLMVRSFLTQRDDVYERISYDSKAFSILFKLELNSLYEAYGDKLLLRSQFSLANRFFQMAKFSHTKTLGKYIRLGAHKHTIDYIMSILGDENEILDEKERIDLAKVGFDCLLAKTIVERIKLSIYKNRLRRDLLRKLLDYLSKRNPSSADNNIESNKNSSSNQFDPSLVGFWNVGRSVKIDPFILCEHTPRGKESKLSANTIVVDYNLKEEEGEEEETITAPQSRKDDTRLECEKSLIRFVREFMPASLYPHIMTQLVDFGLIDLAHILTGTDNHIYPIVRILFKAKDEKRIIFRDGRNDEILEKLLKSSHGDMIKVNSNNSNLLRFITSPEVTKALVKDMSLTSEYLTYQHQTLVLSQRYSSAALCQLEAFRKLIMCQQANQLTSENNLENEKIFTKQHKQVIENIFVEFLNACIDEPTEDSFRLWFNYINFYLNFVGSIEELENEILDLLNSNLSDCRLAITLYEAIGKDELHMSDKRSKLLAGDETNSPLESMKKLYNLSGLFNNEFLMKLLGKTLELVPQSVDLLVGQWQL